ncbi:hypothetical protein DL93DRAFT_2230734 [Clavulina sp. PMI_390]|nr:hypothetical protein DL93DRAFT_2230734 [Clavulina sp. PMI_390]
MSLVVPPDLGSLRLSNPLPIRINQLPIELLIRIFRETIPDPWSPKLYNTMSSVLFTCRFWYSIALDAPIIWASIRFSDIAGPSPRQLESFFERSKSSLLDVCVQLQYLQYAVNRYAAEEKALKFKILLQRHLARVQTLRFRGDASRFFPLEVSSPVLRDVMVRSALRPASDPDSHLPSLVSSYCKTIKTLELNSNDLDPLQLIEPSYLCYLSLGQHMTWRPSSGEVFLQNAQNLRVLRLPNNAFCNSLHTHFDFPLLEEIRLGEPWGALTRHFGPMPNLAHVTLTQFRPHLYDLASLGPPVWPSLLFPSLQTLTVDYRSLPDFAPMFTTSSSIRAIHLHGVEGFLGFLQLLAGQPENDEASHSRVILPKLEYLRLWPAAEPYAWQEASRVDLKAGLMALVAIMRVRAHLRVEIGTRIFEWVMDSPDDPARENLFWNGQWDKNSLKQLLESEYSDILERVDIVCSANKSLDATLGNPPLPELVDLMGGFSLASP